MPLRRTRWSTADRAAVEYWAVVSADGEEETLDRASALLRFGPDGLVVEQRDYWAMQPGRSPANFLISR